MSEINSNEVLSATEASTPEHAQQPNGKRKGSLSSKLFKVVSFLGILVAVIYLIQRFSMPSVDAESTKPVVVDEEQTKTPSTEELDLPEGAITADVDQSTIDNAEHPFLPLLDVAKRAVESIDENIRDYTATLVSQVRIDDELLPKKYLKVKIRHERMVKERKVPFAVYTKFLAPESNVGQEAIWVEGEHFGNLVAHTTGLLNIKRFYLDPDGPIAMEGNRYPIRDIGMRNLVVKMIEIAEKDCQHGECAVAIKRNVDINGRPCTMFEAKHPVKREHFEFHIAKIFIDDEFNVPVAYEGYVWPENEGDPPVLIESYYYTDIEFNVGLNYDDFDPGNKEYNYPDW